METTHDLKQIIDMYTDGKIDINVVIGYTERLIECGELTEDERDDLIENLKGR